jgi:hypothetical protein
VEVVDAVVLKKADIAGHTTAVHFFLARRTVGCRRTQNKHEETENKGTFVNSEMKPQKVEKY